MSNDDRNLLKRVQSAEAKAAANILRQRGFKAAPIFAHYLDHLFGGLPVTVSKINHKTRDRIAIKALKDYGGIVDEVGDTIRVKVTCDTPQQIHQIQQILWRQQELAISRLGRKGADSRNPTEPTIHRIKDNFAEPKQHGYRAMNVKVRMPNGVIAEIQVVHRAIEASSAQTHGAYKQLSALKRAVGNRDFTVEEAEQYKSLVNRLARIYDKIADQHGLNPLLTMTARSRLEERQRDLKRMIRAADKRAAARTTQTPKIMPSGPNADTSQVRQTRLQAAAMKMSSESKLDSLTVKIDWLIDLKDQLTHDGTKASPNAASKLADEINALCKQWHKLPQSARDQMTEGGLAPAGMSRREKYSQNDKVCELTAIPVSKPLSP